MRLVASLAALATPVAAQVRAMPVAAGGMPRGVTVEAEAAFPDEGLGAGDVWGGSLGARFGWLGVAAMAASVPTASGRDAAFGARAEAFVAHSDRSPFQVVAFGGVAAAGNRDAEWRVPLGASVAFRLVLPYVSVAPWLAPRVTYVRPGGGAPGSVRPGLGGGLDVRLDAGLGIRAAYDILFRDGYDERTFGLGVSWTFHPGS